MRFCLGGRIIRTLARFAFEKLAESSVASTNVHAVRFVEPSQAPVRFAFVAFAFVSAELLRLQWDRLAEARELPERSAPVSLLEERSAEVRSALVSTALPIRADTTTALVSTAPPSCAFDRSH